MCLETDAGGEEFMYLAGNGRLAGHEATGGNSATTPLQVNSAQVRVVR